MVLVRRDDRRSLAQEFQAHRAAHPAGAAGHECRLSSKSFAHPFTPVVPSRNITRGCIGPKESESHVSSSKSHEILLTTKWHQVPAGGARMSTDLTVGVPVASVPDGGMVAGHVGEEKVVLVRSGERCFAVGAHCTHYGRPLPMASRSFRSGYGRSGSCSRSQSGLLLARGAAR